MELTIRILNALAGCIVTLAERIRDAAIDRLIKQEDKAEQRRQKAVQAAAVAWDREVKRHQDVKQRLNECACEADDNCASEVQALEEKIKRLELS